MRLRDFRVLSFDCYGTLIDWESGLLAALQTLATRAGISGEAALESFALHEAAQQAETPATLYADLLAHVHHRLADEWV
jgi:FMN phosphatase YigB (HAD superfamily)